MNKACILFLFLFFGCVKKDFEKTFQITKVEEIEGSIPNFSYVGYMRGEKPIPYYKETISISPIEGDNYKHIQDAINLIAEMPLINGHRGVLLLTRGFYEISETLTINDSGIILRGEGQGNNGTHINGTYRYVKRPKTPVLQKTSVISVSGSENSLVEKGLESRIINDVSVGSVIIPIENTLGFQKGDTIQIVKTTNDQWIGLLEMADYGWQTSSFQIPHERIIKEVLHNSIEIDIPMDDAIEAKYGGGVVKAIKHEGRLNNIGIENIRITTNFVSEEDENHLWSAISFTNIHDSWVKNITAEHFAFTAVGLYYSDNITVQDCAIFNFKSLPIGDRRYSFYIHSGTRNLFQRCFSDGGRHDFITGITVSGPNVFLDCVGLNSTSAVGPHLRWATGTLYDNIYAGKIQSIKTKNDGTGHGWTGAYNMYWNNRSYVYFRIEDPPNGTNWLIGPQGKIHHLNNSYVASKGIQVTPRSLYLKQLEDRLGSSAINNITIPIQRGNSPIWSQLEHWRGNGSFL